jgi:hypothetical protein
MSAARPTTSRELEMLDCDLDLDGARVQRDRYREIGLHAVGHERGARRLVVRFADGLDEDLLAEAIAVERECCPFFSLAYDAAQRELRVTVADPRHDPALDAIAESLGAAGR